MTVSVHKKQALRRRMRAARLAHWQAMPESHKALVFSRPPRAIQPLIDDAEVVGVYLSATGEVPMRGYVDQLLDMGKMIALPWTADRAGPMTFRLWTGLAETLQHGPWGKQPHVAMPQIVPQALFMPLVAFDEDLNRLGQGGGHYDRYCAEHPDIKRIGMAWTVQQADAVPTEPHDQPLHAVITEHSLFLQGSQ